MLIRNFSYRSKILFCLWLFFELLMIASLLLTKYLYLGISAANPSLNVSYWLSPGCAIIQTGNLIVPWGGIISSILGSLIPLIYKSRSKVKTIIFILKTNTVFILTSILTTILFELIYFTSIITFSSNIAYHSMLMFIGVLVFLTFWSLFGLGLRLTIGDNLITALTCTAEQIVEYFYIFRVKPQLELFLPYALSREIVIRNFPFWDINSWASINNTFPFASMTIILDSKLHPIYVSNTWIFAFLTGYIIVLYLKPFKYFILKKIDKSGGLENASGNID